MAAPAPLCVHYHRDFDGMVSAAVLAALLRQRGEPTVTWSSVNYDRKSDWAAFERGRRFAVVDFHFHPRAEYWFDHHATTFLTPELRALYQPSAAWSWDPTSPSCPPLILRHAAEHWSIPPDPRFAEMARWSDVIDAAQFEDVEQALFGDAPALRISRSLTAAPDPDWTDSVVGAMVEGTLAEVAARDDVERAWQRAVKNRDKALRQFPTTVVSKEANVLLYDASSNKIRRERFAPFYHHPDIHYAVGVIPTRAGFHVSAGENPWRQLPHRVNVGETMARFGGGGHPSVGGVNPGGLEEARRISLEVAQILRGELVKHLG